MNFSVRKQLDHKLKEVENSQYDVMLQEVQQQFLRYKENTSARLKRIEEMVDLAVKKIHEKPKRIREEFVNPFGKVDTEHRTTQDSLKHIKLNFPRFEEGKEVADWIQDCEFYFDIFGVQENEKVVVAGMHLEGIAKSWYQVFAMGRSNLWWQDFCIQFTARFGMRESELLHERFRNLKQDGSIEAYCDQFALCMEQIKGRMPQLSEEYFVECFVSGLQEDVKQDMKLLSPSSVEGAFKRAKYCVQQQFLAHKERTNQKLQKLEATIEIARQKMEDILSIKAQRIDEDFISPLGWQSDKKSNYSKPSSKNSGTLQHINLRFPEFEEGSVDFGTDYSIGNMIQEWPNPTQEKNVHAVWKEYIGVPVYNKEAASLQDCLYDSEPVYDEDKEPEEVQECWPEKKFILEALEGGCPKSPNTLPSEVCTIEQSEDVDDLSYTQVIHDRKSYSPSQIMIPTKFGDGLDTGLCHALDGFQHLCNQVGVSIMSKEDPTICLNYNQSKDVPCRDSPAAATYSGLEEKSSHIDKQKMIIFDPGGYVHNSKGVNDEIDRVVSEINHQYVGFDYVMAVRKVLPKFRMLQQVGQGSLDKARRFEEHDASRERVMLTTFDPGGNTLVSMRVNLLRKHLKFYMLSSLQVCSKKYLIQEKEDWKCKIHEDMDEF